MKKLVTLILSALACACMAIGFAACGGGGGDTPPSGSAPQDSSSVTPPIEVSVTFDANGGAFSGGLSEKSVTVMGNSVLGTVLSMIETPTRDGYNFTGWYKDGALNNEWDINDTVSTEIRLYAGWEKRIVEREITYVHNYSGAENLVQSTTDGLVTYIPTRTGYVFNGWWISDGQTADGAYILAQKWDTTEIVTVDGLVLYAEWVEASTVSSQLPAPSVSITENVFSWSAIPNAQRYDITVIRNGEENNQKISGTSWTFPSGYEAGYYTVKIRALGDGMNTVNSSWVSKSYGHNILSSISGIEFDISTSVLTWLAVKNAVEYELYVDNVLADTLTYTSYDMSEYEAGNYSIRIVAKREGYQSSSTSKSISKIRLKTPAATLEMDNEAGKYTLSWSAINHADTYILFVEGKEIKVEQDTSYTFDNAAFFWGDKKEITFTMTAFDSNADYLVSLSSEELTVQKVFQLTINQSIDEESITNLSKRFYFHESQLTITAEVYGNYTFIGWFNGEEKLTDKLKYIFTMPAEDVIYTVKYEISEVIFEITSTETDCIITGVKDKTFAGGILIPNYITAIGKGAFSGCSSLTSVTIPDSVTSIGRSAFSGCSSLTGVYITDIEAWCAIDFTDQYSNPLYYAKKLYLNNQLVTELVIPDGVTLIGDEFSDCDSLTSITIPDSVIKISNGAFSGCSSLTRITIGKGVTSIGFSAFSGCDSLTGVYITDIAAWCTIDYQLYVPSNPLEYAKNLYLNNQLVTDLIIPDGVTEIKAWTFDHCSSLTSITIPNSVTSIGDYAFYNCDSLTSVTIGNGVTSIGSYAFERCYKLVEVINKSSLNITAGSESYGYVGYYAKQVITDEADSNVIEQDDYLFYNDKGSYYLLGYKGTATELILPDTVNGNTYEIYKCAFRDCDSLTNIEVGEDNTAYKSIDGNLYNKDGSILIQYAIGKTETSFTIPDSVTSIGKYAFAGCDSLTSVTIPDGITSIGNYAFYYCHSLISVTIGNSVTSIGNYAFYFCDSLTSIVYEGTMAEWKAISKGSAWNGVTGTYTVYCTDGTLSKSES